MTWLVQDIVENLIVGACHELRSREPKWMIVAHGTSAWHYALAGAVVEFHDRRQHGQAMLVAVAGIGVMGAVYSGILGAVLRR